MSTRPTLYRDLLRSAGCEPEVTGDPQHILLKATCRGRHLEVYEGLKPGSSVWTVTAKLDRRPVLLNAREFDFGGSGGGAANMERGTRWPMEHVLKILGHLAGKLTGRKASSTKSANHRKHGVRLNYHGEDTHGVVLRTTGGLYVTDEDELHPSSEQAKVFPSAGAAGDFAMAAWGSIRGLRAYKISYGELIPEML